MKGFIHLQDADTHGRFVTICVSYIVAIVSTRSSATIVKTVEGAKYSVKESLSEVEQKIKDALKNSRCLDNTDIDEEHHESEEVTCGNCEYCVDIDKVHNLCSVHQCYVTYADSCEYSVRKDKIIK